MIITSPIYAFFAVFAFLFPSYDIREVTDTEVVGYIAEFKRDCDKYGRSCEHTMEVPIFWQKIPGSNIGYCWHAGLDFMFVPSVFFPMRVVVLDPDWWKSSDPLSRRQLIYHELGHCELDLDHINISPSIMYPYILGREQIVGNWDCMVDQLFNYRAGVCFDNVFYSPHDK